MRQLVCHLIDVSLDTSYFRAIVHHHDRERFPVMIGSLAEAGSLQEALRELGTGTFALGASRRSKYGLAVARLVLILRRAKVSMLHAHCFDATLVGLLAARIARVSFVFTRHHSDHHVRLGKRWHTWIDARCARLADRVIAVSEATKRVMIDIEGVPEERISVVHNGIERISEPPPDLVARVRQDLGLNDETVMLMVARLHEEKGHLVLFDALARIMPIVGPLTVLLAGEGPYRDRFECEVRRRGLKSIVRFLGRRSDVPVLIALSSVVVLPALAESFGFALLEAMSLGRPVIGSRTGGIPEVVVDGQTGVLVPRGDAAALAAALTNVLKDRQWAEALGEEGRRRAALFSVAPMMRGYQEVYERVLCAR